MSFLLLNVLRVQSFVPLVANNIRLMSCETVLQHESNIFVSYRNSMNCGWGIAD